MLTHLQTLILGVVQGLGEFLPISSSAHLILIPSYMHWPDPGLAYDVALHLGTLLAVVIYFWKELLEFIQAIIRPIDPSLAPKRTLGIHILVATIPGAIVGVLLEHRAETVFRSPFLIAWTLIGLGVLLGIADRMHPEKPLSEMSWPMALGIGLAQSLALIPGVSRSGITITVALALGFRRDEAARFSFLMSIPIIAGAGILKAKQIFLSPDHVGLAIGFAGAAASGLLAISVLMKYVQKHRYTPFVLYRWALGAFVLLNLAHFQ